MRAKKPHTPPPRTAPAEMLPGLCLSSLEPVPSPRPCDVRYLPVALGTRTVPTPARPGCSLSTSLPRSGLARHRSHIFREGPDSPARRTPLPSLPGVGAPCVPAASSGAITCLRAQERGCALTPPSSSSRMMPAYGRSWRRCSAARAVRSSRPPTCRRRRRSGSAWASSPSTSSSSTGMYARGAPSGGAGGPHAPHLLCMLIGDERLSGRLEPPVVWWLAKPLTPDTSLTAVRDSLGAWGTRGLRFRAQ
jgi:hypothetical protein